MKTTKEKVRFLRQKVRLALRHRTPREVVCALHELECEFGFDKGQKIFDNTANNTHLFKNQFVRNLHRENV